MLSHSVSFLRGSRGVAAFFKDAQKANAVIVLDGAEILLSNIASQYHYFRREFLGWSLDVINTILILQPVTTCMNTCNGQQKLPNNTGNYC